MVEAVEEGSVVEAVEESPVEIYSSQQDDINRSVGSSFKPYVLYLDIGRYINIFNYLLRYVFVYFQILLRYLQAVQKDFRELH